MPSIVDKSNVTKICVDDFAIRKRKSYGTVMVDLITHRIIDLLPSRDSKDVKQWLSTFPNIELVARDGAVIYSSAISKSHPNAVQVSDRFHLIKGLAEAINRIIIRLYPARLEIPNIQEVPKEVEVLYNTANRSQRIRFAQKKRAEGLTIEEIALLLHSTTKTVQRYLAIPESKIPENKPNTYERQHQLSVRKKQNEIDEAKELYSQGYPITKIAMMMHHTVPTIKRYLTQESSTINGHYGAKLGGKLDPFHDDVIELRSKGITYPEIQKILSKKGYTGSVASIRVFMQKERSHHYSKTGSPPINVSYVQRKSLCKLIYQKIETIPTLTREQLNMTVERYPLLGTLYSLIKEFYEIIYSKQSVKLDSWIEHAKMVNQPELNTFFFCINKDLTAVKNGITEQYNNGLAEGSVNKIKVIKRIMYGRNSFELLKAKVLFGEYFHYMFN